VGAVHLDRDLAHTEPNADLLVEAAAHHEDHYVTLSERQRGEAVSQFVQTSPLPALFVITAERGMDRVEQILFPSRLQEEIDRAPLHGLHRHRNVGMSGHEDQGEPVIRLRQFALQGEAAQFG
jgi:hypothetical protein